MPISGKREIPAFAGKTKIKMDTCHRLNDKVILRRSMMQLFEMLIGRMNSPKIVSQCGE